MIARRRVAIPSWHLEAPGWVHRVRHVTLVRPRQHDPVPDSEPAAQQAARERRATAIRIDAERHWSSLPRR